VTRERTAEAILWAHSTSPSHVLSEWAFGKGVFFAAGCLVVGLLWLLMVRYTNPLFMWNPILVPPYVVAGGWCLAGLVERSRDFLRSQNLRVGIECLILFDFSVAMAIDGVSLFAVASFSVYALLSAIVRANDGDWLAEAARHVRSRSEVEKAVGRPCPVKVPSLLAAASRFPGFLVTCERYARWLARRGFIESWQPGDHSLTNVLHRSALLCAANRQGQGSWIKIDEKGGCTVFISPRDRQRFGGLRYSHICQEMTNLLAENFLVFIVDQKPGAVASRSASGSSD
jgi:hypothetical protein